MVVPVLFAALLLLDLLLTASRDKIIRERDIDVPALELRDFSRDDDLLAGSETSIVGGPNALRAKSSTSLCGNQKDRRMAASVPCRSLPNGINLRRFTAVLRFVQLPCLGFGRTRSNLPRSNLRMTLAGGHDGHQSLILSPPWSGRPLIGLPLVLSQGRNHGRPIERCRVLQGGHASCFPCQMCREADRQHRSGPATISTEAGVWGLRTGTAPAGT